MKFNCPTGELADAFSAATLALDARATVIASLAHARLIAAEGKVEIVINTLDRVATATAAATVTEAGEAAPHAGSMAELVAKIPEDAVVHVTRAGDDSISVSAGRSRWKIRGLPLENLPALPAPVVGTTIELDGEDVLQLLEMPSHAMSTEETRYYLNGLYLHTAGTTETPMLCTVAADGHRLARFELPLPAGANSMLSVIVPRTTVMTVVKLLKRKPAAATVALHISDKAIEFTLPNLTLISKLIDGTFPDYQRALPKPAANSITVNRADLQAALMRLEAVAYETKRTARSVGLAWAGASLLHACLPAVYGTDDVVDAETIGTGRVAVSVHYLLDALDALTNETVRIASGGPSEPIVITDPNASSTYALVMPVRWTESSSEHQQAAPAA
jgi:DNA polymerase-3 subunit beta